MNTQFKVDVSIFEKSEGVFSLRSAIFPAVHDEIQSSVVNAIQYVMSSQPEKNAFAYGEEIVINGSISEDGVAFSTSNDAFPIEVFQKVFDGEIKQPNPNENHEVLSSTFIRNLVGQFEAEKWFSPVEILSFSRCLIANQRGFIAASSVLDEGDALYAEVCELYLSPLPFAKEYEQEYSKYLMVGIKDFESDKDRILTVVELTLLFNALHNSPDIFINTVKDLVSSSCQMKCSKCVSSYKQLAFFVSLLADIGYKCPNELNDLLNVDSSLFPRIPFFGHSYFDLSSYLNPKD